MNPLRQLPEHGQSIWLDNLSRSMVEGGRLAQLIADDDLRGITSNPAIFHKSITGSDAYDEQIRDNADLKPMALYEALAIRDIRGACDVLRPVFDRTNGIDGYVSLEVSPHLARDTKGTVAEAIRLWEAVERENVMIKIPGTAEGIGAIREVLSRGVNVNVTLLFGLDAYREVMEAHLQALELRREKGEPLGAVASVASFFLSRIDVMVDARLDAMETPEAKELRGRAAVASAKLAYELWKGTYAGPRWEALREAGARVQRPLWASTSTKDDAYSDVKYVEALIGPHTVNTLPDETVEAFRDHGKVEDTVELDLDAERAALDRLAALGIEIGPVADALVEEGIVKFVKPFDALLAALDEKRNLLAAG
jgi:transaldolase